MDTIHTYKSIKNFLLPLATFLLFVFSFQNSYSQENITITNPATTQVTIPVGATNISIEVWGAGGSGGASAKSNSGGGGGGGAYSQSNNIFSPGTYTIQIGNGLGTNDTWFNSTSTIFAEGGSNGGIGAGGKAGSDGAGGNGGNSTNCIGNVTTVSGDNGTTGGGGIGGNGGNGANGGTGGAGGDGVIGSNGNTPGGGGGGGGAFNGGVAGGNGANGQIIITYTLSAVAPTITLTNPNPSVVQGTTSANITYSATTGTPTTYSIIYDATALGQGFADVSGIALTDPIFAVVPSGAAIDVYNGTLTVDNGQESIGYPITIEVTAPVIPTITVGSSPSVVQGITSTDLPYTATTGSPTTYSITYNAAALGAGFANVTDASLFASPIVLTVPLTAPLATYNGTLTVSNGQVSSGYSFTITVTAPIPSITLTDANPSVVQGTTSANITYSSTTGTPTTYSINYDATAESAGFSDVSGIALGSPIVAFVPSGAPLSTYNGILTVNNGKESIGYAITITVTTPPPPTITLGSYPSVLQGTTLANLSYTATANPTSYSITYDAAAISAGFSNITNVLLPASPILLNVPAAAPFAVYNAILTVSNGQVSPNYSFTITIKEIQGHSLTNCSSCHITHSSPGTTLTSIAGNALLCQNCHVSTGEASAKPLVDGNKAIPGASGNSHSWDVPATNPTYQTLAPDAATEMGMRLPGGNIICSTCHDQHNDGNAGSPYLRIDNTGDAMCKVCHSVRDVQLFQNGPTNKGSHPVGVPYNAVAKLNESPTNTKVVSGNVECSSCHGVHDVQNSGTLTTDGNLLRMPKGNSLCMDCHNYPTHNNFDCLDCHEVHNTVDGTIGDNIYMIRDVVNGSPVKFYAESGANSFVDIDGTYDGICEVCHTATIKHQAGGAGATLHNDGQDKREQSCVGCHFHNVGFETPSGPLTCVGCHSSAQSGGRGGVVQIVGATIGEMNNTLSSRHTASGIGFDPLNEECEACHFDSEGTHPTSQMMLNDPESQGSVWSGSDTDNYCIGCHDGAPPVNLPPPGDTKYDKSSYITTPHDTGDNSCILCHEEHGSQYPALTKQSTNYTTCFACHDGGVALTTISSADIANPDTNLGTGHAFDVDASTGRFQSNSPSGFDATMTARLESGNIVCSTCHDSHDNTNGKLLVSPNSGDEMCKACHDARNVGRYADDIANNIGSHPVGVTYTAGDGYVSPAPTLGAAQVAPLAGGTVECSSCHGVHNTISTDGNLLRMNNDNILCKECHDYQPHQGFDCLVCHEAHGSTNIMMLRSTVNGFPVVFDSQTGLNSFSDGVGTKNGICEVCHTSAAGTLYHFADGDDGLDHNDGSNCTSCHSHNGLPPPGDPQIITSFPQGSCHSCHESTGPGDPNVYPMTGAHDKHSGALYGYKCSECHFGYGEGGPLEGTHSNSSVDVNFDPNGLASRFGEDITLGYGTPTWDPGTKTCSNIYCHSTGQSADRGEDIDNDWTNRGTKGPQPPVYASPVWTETITTCDACHGGKGNMTDPYTITMSSPQAHLILDYDGVQTPTSGLHTHSAMFFDSQDSSGPTGSGAVQCYLCHNTNGAANSGTNYQGTYGSPQKLHVDGQTYFDMKIHANGGTWANWNGTADNGYLDHCIGKANWN